MTYDRWSITNTPKTGNKHANGRLTVPQIHLESYVAASVLSHYSIKNAVLWQMIYHLSHPSITCSFMYYKALYHLVTGDRFILKRTCTCGISLFWSWLMVSNRSLKKFTEHGVKDWSRRLYLKISMWFIRIALCFLWHSMHHWFYCHPPGRIDTFFTFES